MVRECVFVKDIQDLHKCIMAGLLVRIYIYEDESRVENHAPSHHHVSCPLKNMNKGTLKVLLITTLNILEYCLVFLDSVVQRFHLYRS